MADIPPDSLHLHPGAFWPIIDTVSASFEPNTTLEHEAPEFQGPFEQSPLWLPRLRLRGKANPGWKFEFGQWLLLQCQNRWTSFESHMSK